MDINVNTVYTTVLNILNKEQRGYMTPAEFNKVATQVQLELFEKFFDDYNQYLRMPKTNEEFASKVDYLRDAMQVFEEFKDASSHTNGIYGFPQDSNNNNEVYRLGSVYFNAVNDTPEVELVNRKQYKQQILSPLTQPSKQFPIGLVNQDTVTIYPKVTDINYFNPVRSTAASDVKFSYIRKPKDVRWGYTIGSLGQYVYDSNPFNETSILVGTQIFSAASSGTATGGTYTNIATTTSGSGTGAVVTVLMSGSGSQSITTTNPTITITSGGTGYAVGDTLTIAAGAFGGSSVDITTTALTASQVPGLNTTTGSINFEIDASQQTEVILEILKYAGIIIRDPQIIQAASQEIMQNEANEKR